MTTSKDCQVIRLAVQRADFDDTRAKLHDVFNSLQIEAELLAQTIDYVTREDQS
jgi:hypothetical protein